MGNVITCELKDMQAVADLHVKLHYGEEGTASQGLRDYYEEMFFQNPWYEKELPSLVYVNQNGEVTGFLGCIPHHMEIGGKVVKVAIAHRLMVDREVDSPMAASRLVRRFLAGHQDLSFSDGANDHARRIWEAAGGRTAYIYSMNWLRPLRPCHFVVNMLRKRSRAFVVPSVVFWPANTIIDKVFTSFPKSPLRQTLPEGKDREIDVETLLDCIKQFSADYVLRPKYEIAELRWMFKFLQANTDRGRFVSMTMENSAGKVVGACLYYMNSLRFCEVIFVAARRAVRDRVFKHVLYHAWRNGAVGAFGRVGPRFLKSIWDTNCIVKRGSWALAHSKNPELIDVINRGDAFITALEGELWLRSPDDRL